MKTTKTGKMATTTKLDKRTKEYKEWKKNFDAKSKGLGDDIEKITKATGIKKAVEWLANGNDCGCDKRRDKLNDLFPRTQINCLQENEYIYLQEIFTTNRNKITPEQQTELIKINNRVFNDKANPTSCGPCFKNNVYNKLKKLYDQYNE